METKNGYSLLRDNFFAVVDTLQAATENLFISFPELIVWFPSQRTFW